MAIPPQFLNKKSTKSAAKRRLDAAIPSTSPKQKPTGGVATFAKPGNQAGKGLLQKVQGAASGAAQGQGSPDLPTAQENFLGQLAHARAGKPKTKVQPAAGRKVAAMKLAAKKGF